MKPDDLGSLLAAGWIPSAKILHPHPNVRFDAKHLK